MLCLFFFFKQKTAYEMRISDWSSDVCSSDLRASLHPYPLMSRLIVMQCRSKVAHVKGLLTLRAHHPVLCLVLWLAVNALAGGLVWVAGHCFFSTENRSVVIRSEEHTSELQSLMRISYAVFCLKKKQIYMHSY